MGKAKRGISGGGDPRRAISGSTVRKRKATRSASTKRSDTPRIEAAQQAIGLFLRSTREAQKLTQEQVSKMTRNSPWQLSRAAISAIERGQNFPGMEAMLALSSVLYVDPKEIVERARLSTVVPLDVTGLSYDELERRAKQFFWAGDFRKALAVYDAQLEKLILEAHGDATESAARVAMLEVRRATALKRLGAMMAAIATAERGVALSGNFPEIQARGYVVLASMQAQRGNLPLARDAAERAIELAQKAGDARTQGWAWNVRAKVHFMARAFEDAKQAYLEARQLAQTSGDLMHLTHNEGNIGICWLEQGHVEEAREWLIRAVEQSRRQHQPALEASWLVELGRMAFRRTDLDEADRCAKVALRIAKPREHYLTIFRAEWLRHLVSRQRRPQDSDRHRLHYLRQLFVHLDQYEGIDEVQEFKTTALRKLAAEERKKR